MIDELADPHRDYFSDDGSPCPSITEIDDFGQGALPFLAEVERLHYTTIFLFPVLERWGQYTSTNDLRGAFIVFLKNNTLLPSAHFYNNVDKRKAFTDSIELVSVEVSKALKVQHDIFYPPQEHITECLADIWRRKLREHKQGDHKPDVFAVTISGNDQIDSTELRSIVSRIMASLSISDFYATMVPIRDGDTTATILIARATKTPAAAVKPSVMRAVGSGFTSAEMYRPFRVTFDPLTPGAA